MMKKTPVLLVLASLLAGGLAHAQTLAVPPGDYVYQGGNGNLRIDAKGGFGIGTAGANGHSCELEGRISGSKATLSDPPCVLGFKPEAAGVRVTSQGEQCREYCGARASFDGMFYRPTPACTAPAIEATRAAFKADYQRKDYTRAVARLAPVLAECKPVLYWADAAWVRNDLALAQLRAGDRAACLATLQPLAEEAGKTEAAIREDYPPLEVDIYLPIAKATRTNLKLCQAGR